METKNSQITLIYRERLAFVAGASWASEQGLVTAASITEEAANRYPMPEPIIYTDRQGYQWRYNDSKSVIEQRLATGQYDWSPYLAGLMLTPERIKIIKELTPNA